MPGGDFGNFTLQKAHPSWTKELLLGATDYYGDRDHLAHVMARPEAQHLERALE